MVQQYPVLETGQSALNITLWQTLFNEHTQLFWEGFNHAAINAQRLSPIVYSQILVLSKLKQCNVNDLVQGLTNTGSLS